jgi:hypothetical protein
MGTSRAGDQACVAVGSVAGEQFVEPRLGDPMGSSDLPNAALLGENRLDDERCELHPDTSPSVSTMSREMRPLSPELRHDHLNADLTPCTRVAATP